MKLVEQTGETANSVKIDMMRCYIYDAADRINKSAKDALNSFAEGDELRMMHICVKRFTKVEPFNTKEAKRRIADKLIEEKRYPF
jgi:hypothetical protein